MSKPLTIGIARKQIRDYGYVIRFYYLYFEDHVEVYKDKYLVESPNDLLALPIITYRLDPIENSGRNYIASMYISDKLKYEKYF